MNLVSIWFCDDTRFSEMIETLITHYTIPKILFIYLEIQRNGFKTIIAKSSVKKLYGLSFKSLVQNKTTQLF